MALQALASTVCRGAKQTDLYMNVSLLFFQGCKSPPKLSCEEQPQHTMVRPHHIRTQEHPNAREGVTNLCPLGYSRVALFSMGLNLLPWLGTSEKHLPWLVGAGKLATTLLKTVLLKISPALGKKSTHLAILTASGLGCAWTQHSPSSSRHQHVRHQHGADLALQ